MFLTHSTGSAPSEKLLREGFCIENLSLVVIGRPMLFFSVVHMICYLRYISNVSTMSCLRLRSKTLNYDVVHHSTPDCQFHLRWINFLALWGASWVPLLPIVLGLALLFPVFDIFLVECCCISAVGAAVLSIQSGSCKCCCSVFLSKCPDWFMTGEKTSETAVPKKIEKLL